MSFSSEIISILLTLLLILNTASRWFGKKDASTDYLEREVNRLRDHLHQLRTNEVQNWVSRFLTKEDFHAEMSRVWRFIEESHRKNNGSSTNQK